MDQALRRHRGTVSGFEVVRLGEADAETLREIRLEALTAHPDAFSADPDVEGAFTVEQWKAAIARRAWFAAKDGRYWLGICCYSRDTHSKKTQHMGSFGAMYVRAAHRGKGVADALIEAALAAAADEIEQMVLTVNAENKGAIALYERHGFRAYGRIPRSIKVGDRTHDELEMARLVSSTD